MVDTEKNRGALLTIWLMIMLGVNIIYAFFYLVSGGFIINLLPSATERVATYIFGILALFNAALTIFLFKWKKWAFFAFCGNTVLIFIINLIIGTPIIASLFGLFLGPLVLYLIMKPKWNLFE